MTTQPTGPGRPRGTSNEDVLDAFDEVEAPVASVQMLVEVVDASEATVLRRLRELHESGDVERLDVGAKAVVWWPSE